MRWILTWLFGILLNLVVAGFNFATMAMMWQDGYYFWAGLSAWLGWWCGSYFVREASLFLSLFRR